MDLSIDIWNSFAFIIKLRTITMAPNANKVPYFYFCIRCDKPFSYWRYILKFYLAFVYYRGPGMSDLSAAHRENSTDSTRHTNEYSHYQINDIQVNKMHLVNKSFTTRSPQCNMCVHK